MSWGGPWVVVLLLLQVQLVQAGCQMWPLRGVCMMQLVHHQHHELAALTTPACTTTGGGHEHRASCQRHEPDMAPAKQWQGSTLLRPFCHRPQHLSAARCLPRRRQPPPSAILVAATSDGAPALNTGLQAPSPVMNASDFTSPAESSGKTGESENYAIRTVIVKIPPPPPPPPPPYDTVFPPPAPMRVQKLEVHKLEAKILFSMEYKSIAFNDDKQRAFMSDLLKWLKAKTVQPRQVLNMTVVDVYAGGGLRKAGSVHGLKRVESSPAMPPSVHEMLRC